MPKTTRPLNKVGIWLNNELGKRNILPSGFAEMVGITPQYLTYIMRNSELTDGTMQSWQERFAAALRTHDKS